MAEQVAERVIAALAGAVTGDDRRLAALSNRTLPPDVVAALDAHGLTALFVALCARGGAPCAPDAAVIARAREVSARALHLLAAAADIANAARDDDVALLFFKGTTLSQRAYGAPALRASADLDVLVRPDAIVRARSLLERLGFARVRRQTARQDAHLMRSDGEESWLNSARLVLVELHTRVSPRRIGVELDSALWRDARTMQVGSAPLLAPGDAALLVLLAVHGAKHMWARGEWLVAFAATWQSSSVASRDESRRVAHEAGASRELGVALALCGQLLPSREYAGDESDAPAIAALARRAYDSMILGGGEIPGVRRRVLFNAAMRTSIASRVRYAGEWLFSPGPEDWASLALPDAMFPLYSVLRPFRLLLRQVAL